MRGQTFTLSNFGTVGGQHAELVVVPPQVGILGVGRMTEQVVAADGAAAVHRILPLSLTFDHRAVTGAEAARFLRAVVEEIERAEPSSSARVQPHRRQLLQQSAKRRFVGARSPGSPNRA